MLDFTMLAFELSFKYRNPVIVAADGYLGQITGRVNLPDYMVKPGLPAWAVWGDAAHRDNLNTSIFQDFADLERHNFRISAKYREMIRNEQRATDYKAEGAKILVVASNTPATTAKAAVERLRREELPVGLFQPVTIWPFPIEHLHPILGQVTDIFVVEASDGQLEDEIRLALQHAGIDGFRFHRLQHMGGIMPEVGEIYDKAKEIVEVSQ
jgi:pyruvate/2-oxoacid:ferredoxin oxidoreductase alpha subunit